MQKIFITLLVLLSMLMVTSCSKDDTTTVVSDEKEKVEDNKGKEENNFEIIYDKKAPLSTFQLKGLYELIGTKKEDIVKHLEENNIEYTSEFKDYVRYIAKSNDPKSPFKTYIVALEFGLHVTKYGKDKESTEIAKNVVNGIGIYPAKDGEHVYDSDYKKVMDYFVPYFNYLVPIKKPSSIILKDTKYGYESTSKTVEEAYKIMKNPDMSISVSLEWNNNPGALMVNSSTDKNVNIAKFQYVSRFHYYSIYIESNLPKDIHHFLK